MKNKKIPVESELGLLFYEFQQNNSGGKFIINDKLCSKVIEAYSEEEACNKGQNLGIYFNGCEDEIDCPCCGDRWYRPYGGMKPPKVWGNMTLEQANKVYEKYEVEIIDSPNKTVYGNADKAVVFYTIEEYAQYQADTYGSSIPAIRIYYHDGLVKEFNNRIKVIRK